VLEAERETGNWENRLRRSAEVPRPNHSAINSNKDTTQNGDAGFSCHSVAEICAAPTAVQFSPVTQLRLYGKYFLTTRKTIKQTCSDIFRWGGFHPCAAPPLKSFTNLYPKAYSVDRHQ